MRLLIISFLFLVSGCTLIAQEEFYNSYTDPKTAPDIESLKEGQEPQIFGTDNFQRDIRLLREKRYVVLGETTSTGVKGKEQNPTIQAKKIGAAIVLTNLEYANKRLSASALFVPSASVPNTIIDADSDSKSMVFPQTTNQNNCNQTTVYLAKSTKTLTFGVGTTNLTVRQRLEIGRNAGALIEAVVEGEPAFDANILAGDLLISIDDTPVVNAEGASQLISSIPSEQISSTLNIIRNGKKKTIILELH